MTFAVAVWDSRRICKQVCGCLNPAQTPFSCLFVWKAYLGLETIILVAGRGEEGEFVPISVAGIQIAYFFHQAVQQRDKVHRENDMTTKKTCTDLTKRSRSPVVLEAEMFREFQDWCLRTYGDSGKTKTVTRRKYNKIMQTLLQNDDSDGVYVDNSHINAKFKFWVKSKGFQVGNNILGEHNKKGASGKPVLYVPVKSTVTCLFLQRYLGRHMKCFYLSWLLSVCASVFVFHTFHLKHINLLFICLRNAV